MRYCPKCSNPEPHQRFHGGPITVCQCAKEKADDRLHPTAGSEAPLDITQLWSLRRDGKLPNLNERQNAILNLWEAWLGEGDYETECITVPNLLNELWQVSSPQNVNVDLPDTAAQDSAPKSDSPAVSG